MFETRLEPMFKNRVFDKLRDRSDGVEARKAYHRMNDVWLRRGCRDIQRRRHIEDIRFVTSIGIAILS
jgi:hypothetical protein